RTSRWLAPHTRNRANQPAHYSYPISFNATTLNLTLSLHDALPILDSEGVDIKINGTSTGNKIPPFPPQPSESWHPFTITSGFVDGVNTLDFILDRLGGSYPSWLRTEVSGTGILLPIPIDVPGWFGT